MVRWKPYGPWRQVTSRLRVRALLKPCVIGRAGHSLFFSRFALRSIFIHGLLSLYRSFCRFSGSLIAQSLSKRPVVRSLKSLFEFLRSLFLILLMNEPLRIWILSVCLSLVALFLIERHRSQNDGSLKSEERLSDFKLRCAQLRHIYHRIICWIMYI